MKRVLFLQGPLGPFFKLLARHFSSMGYVTHKMNFNGGDRHYADAKYVVDYYGTPEDWPSFLTQYVIAQQIDAVVVYGDCRFYHKVARQVTSELGINFWAFEEGYFRSGFVTLEKEGCNANSPLFEELSYSGDGEPNALKSGHSVGPTFARRAWFSFCYYSGLTLFRRHFAHYHHHRPWTFREETYYWTKSLVQKWVSKLIDPPRYRNFVRRFDQQIYLLPLQVEVDFQLREHSHFSSIKQVIEEVLHSFAKYASEEQALLIKHHPQNRGFEHYGELIERLTNELGINERVLYGHDFSLPDVYCHARGVVTVNSTVGISALLHHLPTKVLGKALYDIEGLTYQGDLNNFWQSNSQVEPVLFSHFRSDLCEKTQLAGDFYKRPQKLIGAAFSKITQS